MTIRKSGIRFIVLHFLCWVVAAVLCWIFFGPSGVSIAVAAVGLYMSFFVATFFRIPDRKAVRDDSLVISSADGNVIHIEEVDEDEYFHDRRIRISVFMTFFNVHVNWYPVSGEVRYVNYIPGGKVFAMHSKSSEKNEHTSIVVRTDGGTEIMFRQIAGIVARRIEYDAVEGSRCTQGDLMGMIRFGSRVDVFLPLDAKLLVSKGDLVRGCITPLAKLS
ncbi:MAG: phosphatidylserine decarboxylase family protein [Bacteroidales bacterium]|nr:phosphatidylserine decarboxylase family protein [Bacteroidales bacterium]